LNNFSIIIAYRDREVERVIACLDSISKIKGNREVIFVDYGSKIGHSNLIQSELNQYEFVRHHFLDTEGLIWNKCEALNYGINIASYPIIVIADIDLLLPEHFLIECFKYDLKVQFLTFDCYYLPQKYDQNTQDEIPFSFVGLLVTLKEKLNLVNGFDEYYIGWGVEDDDMVARLELTGLKRVHISVDKLPIKHIWHPVRSPRKPSLWYIQMVQHYGENLNKNEYAGTRITTNFQRPAKAIHASKGYLGQIKLELVSYRKILTFNNFILQFHKMKSGETAWFEFIILPEYKGRLAKLVDRTNNLLKRQRIFNYRFLRAEKLDGEVIIETEDVVNFLFYFIGVNRIYLSDYYLEQSTEKILLILIKK
jgi:hypothetical protein